MYENFMNYYKSTQSAEQFKKNETMLTVVGSFIAGGVAAALTNPFECITVNMQTQ